MTAPTADDDMSVADFNEVQEHVRRELDELIAFASALHEPTEMDVAFALAGKVAMTPWETSLPLILTEAVTRLVAAKQAER